MAEVDAVDADADAEQQRRIVAKCMPRAPDNMNIKEGYYLMTILYKVGILSAYLSAMDYAADNDGFDEHSRSEVEFLDYFDFDNEETIQIDPETGMITSLRLRGDNWDDENVVGVPSIIKQFQMLESIELYYCPDSMFEDVPEGLQLPSIKKISVHCLDSNLSEFLKIFPNTLEELCFVSATKLQTDEILRVLQNDGLRFRHSLTTIKLRYSELNDNDLEILMFEIRERFTNLRKIDVQYSNIGSLVGIEDRIKQIHSSSSSSSSSSSRSVFSDNNLRELNLNGNPVLYHVLIGGGDDDDSDGDNDDDSATTAKYHKEKSALLTFLDTFNGISNLGLYLRGNYRYIGYDPDVEHVLRINNAGRRFISDGEISSDTITTTTTAAPVINHALWPIIFERAYKKSDEIYEVFYDPQEERDKRNVQQDCSIWFVTTCRVF
jgi:hypothetical protein